MINALLDKFRPIARSIKYGRLLRRAQSNAAKLNVPPLIPPVSFIFGCGRSGTTILGKLLAENKDVLYLFEPYHMWRAIQPATDMIQLYGDNDEDTHCILGSEYITEIEIQRFNACMQGELDRCGVLHKRIIEKTPINAMRIPFLNSLSPESPMLHLVRNGVDVVRSIERLSSTNSYQMSGKGNWNQWWGRDHCKWKALASDAEKLNLYPGEIPLLKSDTEMGALEWLVSLDEIERSRNEIGRRLLEVKYNDLTEDPPNELTKICTHFSIEPESKWLEYCRNQLDSARQNQGAPIVLPPKMCKAFNAFQEQYGFEGLATTA
jgi:hypothetical protein